MTRSLPSVTIVRRIKATPAKVYAALTESKLMISGGGPTQGRHSGPKPTYDQEVALASYSGY